LNVHGVNDVRQTEILIAEQLVTESSYFAVKLLFKSSEDKSPGADKIPAYPTAVKSIILLYLFIKAVI
jgi:hypothetical protein